MRIDELERTLERLERAGELERVKLIYTITEHANPTRDQPGRRAARAAGRAGPTVVEAATGSSSWRTPPIAA